VQVAEQAGNGQPVAAVVAQAAEHFDAWRVGYCCTNQSTKACEARSIRSTEEMGSWEMVYASASRVWAAERIFMGRR
jgi:hypothetical protein